MRSIFAIMRTMGLLGSVLIILSACGSSGAAAPTTISGPALLFFYTDN